MSVSLMFLRAPTRTLNLRTLLAMTFTTSCMPSLPLLAFSLPLNTTTLTTSMAALFGILISSQLSMSAKLRVTKMPTLLSMSSSPQRRLLRPLMLAAITQSRCSGVISKFHATTPTWMVSFALSLHTPTFSSVTSLLHQLTCHQATILST